MSRQASITKTELVDAAYAIAAKEGMDHVSARTLAAEAGCSTQPIFRIYKNMDELRPDVFEKAVSAYTEYYAAFPKKNDTPFVNLGLAYIRYAQENPKIFELLFLSKDRYGKSLYDILNGEGAVVREFTNAKFYGCTNPSSMFTTMWIFIHGAACMALTGDYDLQEEETISLLADCYRALLALQ